jgi:hypothetical protein
VTLAGAPVTRRSGPVVDGEPKPASGVAGPGPRRKMVFVGGLHRSGTTHLVHLLGQHPDASVMMNTGVVMDEGQYLQDVYPQDWQLGGPGCFAYAPNANQTEQQSAGKTTFLRDRLLQQWTPYWDMSRSVLIEKTPGNVLSARFLQSLFPDDAYFVFITRHPVAVSLATRKWSRTSLFALVDHWLAAHDILRQDLPYLRRAIVVSYEALVADPAGTLADVQAFIGMRSITVPDRATHDLNLRYFAVWKMHYLTAHPRPTPQRVQSGQKQTPSLVRRAVWAIRGRGRRYLLRRSGIDILWADHEGRAILARHESRIRSFGYSLLDLSLHPARATVKGPDGATPARP